MSPCLHYADPLQTYRQNCRIFTHDCPVPSSSSTSAATASARALAEALIHPTPTLFATLGDDQFSAIQTLFRIFSNVTDIPPTAPSPIEPRPAPPVAFQTDCPTPSTRLTKLPPNALPPRLTILPSADTPDKPPPLPTLCLPSHSETHHVQGVRPQHQDLPSSNLTVTTQFCNRAITYGHVHFRLPPTVGKPAPNRVMLPRSATCSNKKNKSTSSLTQPAVRRSNIGTSSVALTAPPGSRPLPNI